MNDVATSFFRRTSAPGVAALACLRMSGPATARFLRRTFRVERELLSGSLHYVRIRDGEVTIDDAMLRIDRTYPHLTVTLTVHGSAAVDAAMRRILVEDGFVESHDLPFFDDIVVAEAAIGPFLSGEIRAGLAGAKVAAAAEFFGYEAEGRLVRTVRGLAKRIANIANAPHASSVASVRGDIESLLFRARFGCAWMIPPRVVVVGPVNAGKSTLFNALLGRDRSIVSDLPGTTRDVVESPWIVRGLPFTLVDTAGIREATNAVEKEGIARAQSVRAAADIVLSADDGSDLRTIGGKSPTSSTNSPVTTIRVVTKIDLREGAERSHPDGPNVVRVSAAKRLGLDRLENAVVAASPFRLPVGSSFPCPFTPRHVNLLRDAIDALDRGLFDPAKTSLVRICE